MTTEYTPRLNTRTRSLPGTHRATGIREATIEAGPGVILRADLTVPSQVYPEGAVLFAHSSYLTRRHPRNRAVVAALSRAGFATLLVDVLTLHEQVGQPPTADVELLSQRIQATTHWLRHQPDLESLTLGYLGDCGSSAGVLLAAAELQDRIGAVVSWGGGRCELAQTSLDGIVAPVLLIVDGHEEDLERGYEMRKRLQCPSELAIVPGVTCAFEQFGPVQRAAQLAADWFASHLTEAGRKAQPRRRRS